MLTYILVWKNYDCWYFICLSTDVTHRFQSITLFCLLIWTWIIYTVVYAHICKPFSYLFHRLHKIKLLPVLWWVLSIAQKLPALNFIAELLFLAPMCNQCGMPSHWPLASLVMQGLNCFWVDWTKSQTQLLSVF